jgi:hypothetical protein
MYAGRTPPLEEELNRQIHEGQPEEEQNRS